MYIFEEDLMDMIKNGNFKRAFDGGDYDQGQLEDMEKTMEKLVKFNSSLLAFLSKKNIINSEELLEILKEIQ